MNLIERIKTKINITKAQHRDPIIIAGLGRCGTTLVYKSIMNNHYYKGYDGIVQISNYKGTYDKRTIYKTHDYPPLKLPKNVKVIFMFGDLYNTVVSTHYQINLFSKLHHKHLSSKGHKTNDEIFYKDTFNLNKLFEAWYQPQNFEFLSLRYESLYKKKTIEVLSEFLELDLQLLPQKTRKTDWTKNPLKEEIVKTYGVLYDKIEKSDDVKIWKIK